VRSSGRWQSWPLAILAVVLAVGATWIGRVQKVGWLSTGAAAGALAIVATWLGRYGSGTERVWDVTLSALALAAAFQGLDAWFARGKAVDPPRRIGRWSWNAPVAPAIVAVGLAWMLPIAAVIAAGPSPWPWLVGALGLATLLHLQGRSERAGILRFLGGAAAGVTLAVQLIEVGLFPDEDFAGVEVSFLWMAGGALLLIALAWRGGRSEVSREAKWSWHAAAAFLVPLLFVAPQLRPFREASPLLFLMGTLGLALLISISAIATRRGFWYAVAGLLLFPAHGSWNGLLLGNPEQSTIADDVFLVEFSCWTVLVALVFLFRKRFSESRLAWRAAAVLPLLSFPLLDALLETHFDVKEPFWTPLALVLLSSAGWLALRWRGPEIESTRRSAERWFGSVSIFLGSLFIARFIGHDVFVATSSLTGLGLAILWRRREAPGLKFAVFTFFVVAAFGVVGGCGQKDHYPGSDLLVFNWTSYGTILPVIGALVAAALIRPFEAQRVRNWERRLYTSDRPWIATLLGLGGALGLFVWLNLQVFLYFETEAFLRIEFTHFQARDLTMSIVWILYGLVLLTVGMARNSSGMRWISLAFLILSLGKVFLHDLGDLEGLYRVGSLLGLAMSLLLVSVLYQKFVFPRERKGDPDFQDPAD
jgi:hypothetical protein